MALLSVFNRLIERDLIRCGVASRHVEIQGAQVHYYEASGHNVFPPTLLIHGFGDTANTWYQVLVPLAKSLGRVLALDYPGVGFSTLPRGRDYLKLKELEGVIEEFGRQVLGEPALIVGHSLGGALTLHMAAHQDEQRSVRPPLWTASVAISPAGARLTPEQWEELRGIFDVPDRTAARELLERNFNSNPWPLRLVENDVRAVFRSPPVRKLLQSIEARDFLSPEELARIQIPTLILWGTEERVLPATLVEYYRQHLPPNATLEVVKGWPHASQVNKPDEVVAHIVAFAERLKTATTLPALSTERGKG
jgi:pimeloyl-ACP methyl ester carboxylesterase